MEYKHVRQIVNNIKHHINGLHITGSVKRKSAIINDIYFIKLKKLDIVMKKIKELYPHNLVLKEGDKHSSISLDIDDKYVQVDIWKAENKYGLFYQKFNRDMTKGQNIGYKKMAKNKGYLLSDDGLYDENSNLINITNVNELKTFLKS